MHVGSIIEAHLLRAFILDRITGFTEMFLTTTSLIIDLSLVVNKNPLLSCHPVPCICYLKKQTQFGDLCDLVASRSTPLRAGCG